MKLSAWPCSQSVVVGPLQGQNISSGVAVWCMSAARKSFGFEVYCGYKCLQMGTALLLVCC